MYKVYRNKKLTLNIILVNCIVLSVFCLAIGYAQINSINLGIQVSVETTLYEGMFISNVKYDSDNGADTTNSKIIDYTGTMLHSDIFLSSTDNSSSITYTMTIFNNSDAIKKFTGVTYADGAYSNSNINYRIDGLNLNETIEKGEGKTFNIVFYYNNIQTITNNNLNSYLSFNFDYYYEEENEVDIVFKEGESYQFAGVSESNPIGLANIANINFAVMNSTQQRLTGVDVAISYITSTGSKQSAIIELYDSSSTTVPIKTQTAQFAGKQESGSVLNVQFTDLNIGNKEKMTVKFKIGTMNNGNVNVTNVTITPVFE